MKGSKQSLLWQHIRKAQETVSGESQRAEYVARLDLAECAGVLATSPEGLPFLAARRDECRVGSDETRSFEEVIRVWTLSVLSSAEGG